MRSRRLVVWLVVGWITLAARAVLPAGAGDVFEAGEGIFLTLVQAETDVEYDLDHVALWSTSPADTAQEYERYGFSPAGPARVEVGGAFVVFHKGDPGAPERPLLNHLAVLVDSADDVIADAGDLGIEVEGAARDVVEQSHAGRRLEVDGRQVEPLRLAQLELDRLAILDGLPDLRVVMERGLHRFSETLRLAGRSRP